MTIGPAGANYKPNIPRNDTNVIVRAEAVRDKIYTFLNRACVQENVEAEVLASAPYSGRIQVSFECWVRHPQFEQVTDRSSALITIRPLAFHQYDCELDIEVRDGLKGVTKPRKINSVIAFSYDDALAIVRYLVRKQKQVPLRFQRCRAQPLQLWLPKNKIKDLKSDWGQTVVAISVLIGILTLAVGIGFVLLIAPLAWYATRRRYALTPGKPFREPRYLLALDSWQTVVYDLGSHADTIKANIKRELNKGVGDGMALEDEKIWYRGMDGKEEREQIVVMFRRAIGFIHVYSYGNDLYIGWDAHINRGIWTEKTVGMGIDPRTGVLCSANTIVPGWITPSEYDLTDTNCLIEWIHAAITKVTKQMMADHQIDQEVDFKILRGERQGITQVETKEKGKPSALKRFKREE